MKTGCLIFSNNEKYTKLHNCAVNSFKKFHEDVIVFSVTHDSDIYSHLKNSILKIPPGIQKYIIANYLFSAFDLSKIIILGADTITCDRLNEFLENDDYDILTTLDYPYQLVTSDGQILSSLNEENHVNADVVCFNNKEALLEVIKTCEILKTEHFEQAALNYVCNILKKYKSKIVDGDFQNSSVVYNARAKGNLAALPNTSPWFKYTLKFKTKGNKLYTSTHENISKSKQIKVWHYCDALGHYSGESFENKINDWINNGFNQETKDFFTNECNCGDFFKQKFTI